MHSRHEYGGMVKAGESAKFNHGNAAAADGMAENTSSGGLPLTMAAEKVKKKKKINIFLKNWSSNFDYISRSRDLGEEDFIIYDRIHFEDKSDRWNLRWKKFPRYASITFLQHHPCHLCHQPLIRRKNSSIFVSILIILLTFVRQISEFFRSVSPVTCFG